MSALMIINYDIVDPDGVRNYRQVAGPVISAGARLVALHKQTVDLGEGGQPGKVTAILEFPTVEAAQAAYGSAEYQKLLPLRLDSTRPAFAIITEVFDEK